MAGCRVGTDSPLRHIRRYTVSGVSRPGMDRGGGRSECCAERREVFWVAGQDVVAQANGGDHQVGVDDVCCSGLSEELSDLAAVVERVDRDGLEECRESGLSGSVAPHLPDDGVGGVESGFGSACSGQERVGGLITPVDGDEEPGVENHRSYRSAIAATSSSLTGPCSVSHSARKALRAFRRFRSAARLRRAWRIALERPPYSGASMSRRASSSSSSRTVVVLMSTNIARSCYIRTHESDGGRIRL